MVFLILSKIRTLDVLYSSTYLVLYLLYNRGDKLIKLLIFKFLSEKIYVCL